MVEDKVKDIFQKLGIVVETSEDEIILDSLQFINIVVSIEDEFSIVIEEKYLSMKHLKSFSDYINLINQYLGII